MTFPGWDPAEWMGWILSRPGLAGAASGAIGATASVITIEITGARLVGTARPGDDRTEIELRLRVSGLPELHRALGATVAGVLFGPGSR
jgi:hypothetical protein